LAGEKTSSPSCYQLHSVEGRAKCPAVPQLRELFIGTRAAVKAVNKQVKYHFSLSVLKKILNGRVDRFVIKVW